ncbi:hypothetical protein V1477_020768 [Vespula maculifrons]|uniref:Uncharacterized protein n=1 Tax=Vespula maculifrons TaxID=7453 RepID=A0ABD2AMU7_VESMC
MSSSRIISGLNEKLEGLANLIVGCGPYRALQVDEYGRAGLHSKPGVWSYVTIGIVNVLNAPLGGSNDLANESARNESAGRSL